MSSNFETFKINLSRILGNIRAFTSHMRDVLIAIFDYRVEIITLTGQMPGDAGDIELLYVGRNLNLPHFKKKFFTEAVVAKSQKVSLFTFRTKMKSAEESADVVFLDVGWPYNGPFIKSGEYLEIPDWISMIVPLDPDWDNVTKNFRKTMRKNIGRLIRRNEYRCEPTNDPEIIKNYYEDYYVPFINTRHAGEAFLTSRKLIEFRARHGTVLQVIGKDGPVAAGVYFPANEALNLLVAGMPTKHIENPPEAAISALYFFSLRYAFENGLKAVNFMGTRSFPTDGVFQFKRKWGAKIEDSFSVDSFLFKPAKNSLKAVKFCEQFPLVTRNNEALELVVGATGEQFGDAECDQMLLRHHCEGVERVRVVHLNEGTQTPAPPLSSKHANVAVVSCGLAGFADHYTEGRNVDGGQLEDGKETPPANWASTSEVGAQ